MVRPGRARSRYRFVGGKGGVGKTTCAAAIALHEALSGARALIVSTDPAPSLGDALGVRLARRPRGVPVRRGSLHAVEVDAGAVIREWLSTRSSLFQEIALRGTWLDAEDVGELLQQSLPGIDELAGLLEVVRFGRSGRYDVIVVDTAPTGHTLRMLTMPDTLARIAEVFDAMQAKHRAIVAALRGRWTPDAADDFIASLAADARELGALVRDRDRTAVSWVSLAERMAVEETLDALSVLKREQVAVQAVILNRVIPADRARCRLCGARRRVQQEAADVLGRRVPQVFGQSLPTAIVSDQVPEPRGIPSLTRLGSDLVLTVFARSGTARPPTSRRARGQSVQNAAVQDVTPWRMLTPCRMLWFGGKGGVGKTTCAAAAAVTLALASPKRRILLLSTDPAHSLGDVLGTSVSNDPRRIPSGPRNLDVRELDIADALRRARGEYTSAIDGLFDRTISGIDATHDRRVMHALLDLAPPGLDELVAILDVTALMAGESSATWDQIVIDTAPTGHALRLLEMPALIHGWTHALMRIVLKYQPVVGAGGLGPPLLAMSKRIAALRRMLTDRRQTQFVVVTRAAALPRAETLRFLPALASLGIAVPAVIVNAIGQGSCHVCRRAAAAERREVTALSRALKSIADPPAVVLAPTAIPPPAGPAMLARWRRAWQAMPPTRSLPRAIIGAR